MEDEELSDTLALVLAQAVVNKLSDSVALVKVKKHGYSWSEVKAKALVETQWHKIEEEVETLYNTVGEVEGDVLVNKVVRRLALLRLRTLADKLTEIKAEAMVDTLSERLRHLEI